MSATFAECVTEAFGTPDLMHEYRRLTGSTLGLDERTPITRAIDDTTGHDPWHAEWSPFFEFVRDCVWLPLVATRLGEQEQENG